MDQVYLRYCLDVLSLFSRIPLLKKTVSHAHERVAELLLLPGEVLDQSRERINKDQQNSLHHAFPASVVCQRNK